MPRIHLDSTSGPTLKAGYPRRTSLVQIPQNRRWAISRSSSGACLLGAYIPKPNDFVSNPRVPVLNDATPARLFGMPFTQSTQPVMNAEIARVNLVNAAVKAAHPEIIIVQTIGFSQR